MKFNKIAPAFCLALLLSAMSPTGLFATKILGTEITYTHIQGYKYQFTLKVYRDCNECKFNGNGGGDKTVNCSEIPNLFIRAENSNSELGEIEMVRQSIQNLSKSCYGSNDLCMSGGNQSYGIEVHEFTGMTDLSEIRNNGNCKLNIGIFISTRKQSLNSNYTEQNHYNFCQLNICGNNDANLSTRFVINPLFKAIQNQPHYMPLGIINDDHDSLSFELVQGMSNPTSLFIYPPGRTGTNPVATYCVGGGGGCIPNPNSSVPIGFYLDPGTGDLVFYPINNNENGLVVIECKEWKKGLNGTRYLAGITRRDFHLETINSSNNVPKLTHNQFSYAICEGESLCFDFSARDNASTGLPADSVTISIINQPENSNFTSYTNNAPPYSQASFCWNTKENDVHRFPYFITFLAEDNACPNHAISGRTVLVKVHPVEKTTVKISTLNCGQIRMENQGLINPGSTVQWTVKNSSNEILSQALGKYHSYTINNGDKYTIECRVTNPLTGCTQEITNSIDLNNFKHPQLKLGPKQVICPGKVVIEPVLIETGIPGYEIFYNGNKIEFPFSTEVYTDTRMRFTLVDNFNCVVHENIDIEIFKAPEYTFSDHTICNPQTAEYEIEQNLFEALSNVSSAEFYSAQNGTSILNKNGIHFLVLNKPVPATYNIGALIISASSCAYLDTITIQVTESDPALANRDFNLCSNGSEVSLNAITLNRYPNPKWSGLSSPVLNGDILDPDYMVPGNYQLFYSNEFNGCTIIDTIRVHVLDTSKIIFISPVPFQTYCVSSSPITLMANPIGGSWIGPGITNNIFNPKNLQAGIVELKYTFHDMMSGCISTERVNVILTEAPEVKITSKSLTFCEGTPVELKGEITNSSSFHWSTIDKGAFAGNTVEIFYSPTEREVAQGFSEISLTAIGSNSCPSVTELVKIQIIPKPKGSLFTSFAEPECEPRMYDFSSNFVNIDKITWFSNNQLIEDFDYDFPFSKSFQNGEYQIHAVAYNKGCESKVFLNEQIVVLKKPMPEIYSDPDKTISREYPRLYLRNTEDWDKNSTYKWYLNNVHFSDDYDTYYNVPSSIKDTLYLKLIVSNNFKCESTATKVIVFNPINVLYIPDVFSPNKTGPEANNLFIVSGPAMRHFNLEIFNKWGEVVFRTDRMSEGWDGMANGKACLPDVYVYKINTTDNYGVSRDYKGTVTLLR